MIEDTAISVNTITQTQDFNYLRAKGLEYIKSMGSSLWTDHNLHDPGITILEVLCHALSDLGFRLNFSIKDLLTEPDHHAATEAFHTAYHILSNAPLSISDYRKILIDLKGVRNAWLFAHSADGSPIKDPITPDFYAWCRESKLVYDKDLISIPTLEERTHVKNEEKVTVKGLYAVKIELDEHPVYGDLNSTEIEYIVKAGAMAGHTIEVRFPKFEGLTQLKLFTSPTYEILEVALINDTNLPYVQFKEIKRSEWKVSIKLKFDATEFELTPVVVSIVKSPVGKLKIKGSVLLEELGPKVLPEISLSEVLINRYKVRPQQIISKVKEVREVLQANRNLCEDFLWNIDLVDTEELVFCADLDVQMNIDLEDVQAQIFVAIENYLLPPVHFNTLKELIAEGVPTEEIFEGPVLKNGFIKDEVLEAAQLKDEYFLSDIINIIMDIPGVINIRNFSIRITDPNGQTISSGQLWRIPVTLNHKLRFNRKQSKFMFFKNTLPLLANYEETLNKIKLYASLDNQRKNVQEEYDLPVPVGKFRNLDKHYTILNEFPALYGVGNKKLPEPLTEERKAQVKQLEGYLLFYDQLLANYFRQVHKLKDILSWNDTETATYYSNYFYLDKNGTHTELATSILYDYEELKNNTLQKITQSPNTFLDHKNRILDHLIARFAESFNDYALYMYAMPDMLVLSDEKVAELLIKQKTNFLKSYPALSAQRAKAFNYAQSEPDVWQSHNLSGYESRVRGLLGMSYDKRGKLQDLTEDDLEGGLHVFEHLLLRPNTDHDRLMSICIEPDCDHCSEEDPYSFKMSVVIPYWIKRFKNTNFRNYIETLLRREAPAHILLKICWIGKECMITLEEKYEAWLKQKALYFQNLGAVTPVEQDKYTTALNEFIEEIEKLRTEFEVGQLHNCEDSEEGNDNRMRLGHSNLGTFKSIDDE